MTGQGGGGSPTLAHTEGNLTMYGTCSYETCGATCVELFEIHGAFVCASCGIARLIAAASHYDGRGDEYLNNSELEEMHAASAVAPSVPEEDWAVFAEAVYCDPAEVPCCADRLCPCGGYRGGNHGPAPYAQ